MLIMTVNAGSSSLRLGLFNQRATDIVCLHKAHHDATALTGQMPLAQLLEKGSGTVDVVAHRIVHGGDRHQSCLIDTAVEQQIEACAPYAPLHNPVALQWVRACREQLGEDLPQVAVFDTAFYADLPEVAATYPLPYDLCREHGLRRFGFHGIAHAAMWRRWCALHPEIADGGRIISLQLGAGCSITATARGRAIDTSMGFTPLEGLMMATRSGDIDPGLLLHLQRYAGMSVDDLEEVLTHNSGLRGVSGISGDMRELLGSRDSRAVLAIEVFCYRARKYIGAYLAALGGVDGILFGGGIGEHHPEIRSRILDGLEDLGIVLDSQQNRQADADTLVSATDSRIEVRVIQVDEEAILVEEAFGVMKKLKMGG